MEYRITELLEFSCSVIRFLSRPHTGRVLQKSLPKLHCNLGLCPPQHVIYTKHKSHLCEKATPVVELRTQRGNQCGFLGWNPKSPFFFWGL